jgi:A/G-specific adenine glycosylase
MVVYHIENSMVKKQDEIKGKTHMSRKVWAEKFRHRVLDWFEIHERAFPWRMTTDPFHIFMAEILLRQTQAERVTTPYRELVSQYPNAYALAKADVEVLRSWFSQLGLVKRSDYLVRAAKTMVQEYNGEVPRDLQALLRLPGLGTYSARAILSLAFGVPVPMIDESSGRLFRRVLGLGHKGPAFSDRSLLSKVETIFPGLTTRAFNLGILDIAVRYCHTKSPNCSECPVSDLCQMARA